MLGKYNVEEIELIRLCKELKYEEGFSAEKIKQDIKNFVGKNKNLKALYNEIMKNPKEIPQEYIDKVNSYEKDTCNVAAISGVQKFIEKGIENITEEDRKEIVSLIIAGTLNKRSDLGQNEEIIRIIEQLCPDVNLSDKEGKKDIRNLINDNESLANLKKYLPLDEKREFNSESVEMVAKAFRLRMIKEIDLSKIYILGNFLAKDMKSSNIGIIRNWGRKLSDAIMNKFWEGNVEELDVNKLIDEMSKSVEEKFFDGSKIRFTTSDKGNIKSLYENSTDACWISSKQQYLDLKISSLLQMETELQNKKILSHIESKRLDKIQDRIRDFYETNPEYNFNNIIGDDSELKPEAKKSLDKFEDYKVKSKLMSTYMKNSSIVSSQKDYEKLDNEAKKEYLKNTIVGLSYKKNSGRDDKDEKLIGKFAERRLEIIGDRKNKFISIRSWGEGYRAEVDYDKILEEYNKYSKHKFKRFEELEEYCNSNKKMYVAEKLDEYKLLKDEDFRETEGKTVHERVKFIEGLKYYINEREEKTRKSKTKANSKEKESSNKTELEETSRTNEENSSVKIDKKKLSKDEADKEEKSDLPVPINEKQGFFKRLFSKVKGIFTSGDKSKEETSNLDRKDDMSENSNNAQRNDSNSFIEHVEVNTLEAVDKFNNGSNGSKEISTEKDGVVVTDDSSR